MDVSKNVKNMNINENAAYICHSFLKVDPLIHSKIVASCRYVGIELDGIPLGKKSQWGHLIPLPILDKYCWYTEPKTRMVKILWKLPCNLKFECILSMFRHEDFRLVTISWLLCCMFFFRPQLQKRVGMVGRTQVFLWCTRFLAFHSLRLGRDIGAAKELGVIYFLTNWGAQEPQNLPNPRVVDVFSLYHSSIIFLDEINQILSP